MPQLQCSSVDCIPPSTTEVVVVGSGPSAIFLSFILSGYRPYYVPSLSECGMLEHYLSEMSESERNRQVYSVDPHPDRILHEKLGERPGQSVLEMDLLELGSYLIHTPLSSRSPNRLSLLLDTLTHPNCDADPSSSISRLLWIQEARPINHIVLEKNRIGGLWSTKEMSEGDWRTLSYKEHMELPGWTFEKWLEQREKLEDMVEENENWRGWYYRPKRNLVGRYYRDYVNELGLKSRFFETSEVLQITESHHLLPLTKQCGCQKFTYEDINRSNSTIFSTSSSASSSPIPTPTHTRCKCLSHKFLIRAIYRGLHTPIPFSIRSNHVVLASGLFQEPKWIGVRGEDVDFVFHQLQQLGDGSKSTAISNNPDTHYNDNRKERSVQSHVDESLSPIPPTKSSRPVVIIGSGLSAADCIIHHLKTCPNVPIIHIYQLPTSKSTSSSNSTKATSYKKQNPLSVCHHSDYPEYWTLWQWMKSGSSKSLTVPSLQKVLNQFKPSDPISFSVQFAKRRPIPSATPSCYIPLCNAALSNISKDQTVDLALSNAPQSNEIARIDVEKVIILVGRDKDFRYLSVPGLLLGKSSGEEENQASEEVLFDPVTYEVFTRNGRNRRTVPHNFEDDDTMITRMREYGLERGSGVFAIGSLTGDSTVRFLLGSSFGVASELIQRVH
ncbi:hypothetical protein BKA69DRAFT_1055361 [Paraphysoderma sedebokerense]|nr:hypothetical protein BKA69DRAFT_1055361 [Paraphysoderma sedebokerense]